jgi:hypothetical protein
MLTLGGRILFICFACSVSGRRPCPLKVFAVAEENPKAELARLLRQQRQARQDEVFGGLSHTEQAEYDSRAKRIHELDSQTIAVHGEVNEYSRDGPKPFQHSKSALFHS